MRQRLGAWKHTHTVVLHDGNIELYAENAPGPGTPVSLRFEAAPSGEWQQARPTGPTLRYFYERDQVVPSWEQEIESGAIRRILGRTDDPEIENPDGVIFQRTDQLAPS